MKVANYIDPFHKSNLLIVENTIPLETNLDAACQLGKKELDSNRTQKEAQGVDEDVEDTWELENRPRNVLDLFNDFDDEPSL